MNGKRKKNKKECQTRSSSPSRVAKTHHWWGARVFFLGPVRVKISMVQEFAHSGD